MAREWRAAGRLKDRGEWAVEYLGRSDFQVKIRGFRVELGEIDAAVGRHTDVEFAVTLGVPLPSGATTLVTYVLPRAGSPLASDDDAAETIRTHAAATLPAHMVPGAVVVLGSVPLTPAGKLDRRALPAPEFTSTGEDGPGTDVERALAEVFSDVLGLPSVGVHDSFFDVGGNSILATTLTARIRELLDAAAFSVADVFEARTVRGIAARVSESGRSPGDVAAMAAMLMEFADGGEDAR